jgi:hypothetical protein
MLFAAFPLATGLVEIGCCTASGFFCSCSFFFVIQSLENLFPGFCVVLKCRSMLPFFGVAIAIMADKAHTF